MDTTLLDPTPMCTQDLMFIRIHTDIIIPIIKRYGSRTVEVLLGERGDVKGAKAPHTNGVLAFFTHGAYYPPRVRMPRLWPLQEPPERRWIWQ